MPSAEERAVAFVRLLETCAYRMAVQAFDDTMRRLLPEEQLKAAWQETLERFGSLQAISRTDISYRDDVAVVVLFCVCDRRPLAIRVVFDSQERVAGLFFLTPPRHYTPPSYVNMEAVRERDVVVDVGGWPLPGTVSYPAGMGDVPGLVLVHGSGPNDRDETAGENKPFRDLALGLASRGIAVLCYDKRTRVHASRLAREFVSFTVADETIDDAAAAIALLRTLPEVDPRRVFVAGHSLGGELLPRIALRDTETAGLIFLAASTRPMGPMMAEQLRHVFAREGTPPGEQASRLSDLESVWQRILRLEAGEDVAHGEVLLGAPAGYWIDMLRYDALRVVQTVHCPMYFAQGGKDYQVTVEDFDNWRASTRALSDITFKFYPALNHAFVAEEDRGEEPLVTDVSHVAVQLVEDLSDWITR